MAEFIIDGKVQEVKEPWTVFIVYGSFMEPTKSKNFVIVRMPSGRMPWSKKIAPAINKLVRPWYTPGVAARDKFWNVDGEPTLHPGDKRLWDSRSTVRYEWDGSKLVRVED